MKTSTLIGKIIQAVWSYPCDPVHLAWVNELTMPIATSEAFLELSSGELIRVSPCEVKMDEKQYPSLGLELESCTFESTRVVLSSGKVFNVEPLSAAAGMLPFTVADVQESDPLGEGAISQLCFTGDYSQSLTFRHTMPPMTLGICAFIPG